MKNQFVQFWYCKLRYLRNGQNLKSLIRLDDGRFYIYQLGNAYIASEALNWYLTRNKLEQEVLRISCRYYVPQPGDTVVDLGAGLGEEVGIYAAMVGPTGRVFAIEANPAVYRVLRKVVTLNHFENVRTFNLAISEKAEKVIIHDVQASYLSSALNSEHTGTAHEVDGISFGDFCASQRIHEIHLLKVNIEGAERFLTAAFSLPNLRILHVAISCHDFRFVNEGNDFFRTKQLVIDYLTANGYETRTQQTGIEYIDDWVYGRKQDTRSPAAGLSAISYVTP